MTNCEQVLSEARKSIADLAVHLGISAARIKITVQVPEEIPPTDKPIDRHTALVHYAMALILNRPHMSEEDLLEFVDGFNGSITSYLGTLDQLAPHEKLHGIEDSLERLHSRLHDEDEDLSPNELQSNERLKEKIKSTETKAAEVQFQMKFFQQEDLRYLLASDLNCLLHRKSDASYETLIRRALKKHLATNAHTHT